MATCACLVLVHSDSGILDVERDGLAERPSAAADPSSGSARASRCVWLEQPFERLELEAT